MSVIVDDRDISIQYIPGWINLGESMEFRSTTSQPGATGDKAEFTFNGTSVSIYGTSGTASGSSMAFSVDGGDVDTFTVPPESSSPTHHQLFYSSPVLSDGLHTLLIQSTNSSGVDGIFIDYLLYDAASTAGKMVFVDDNDSGVEYSSGWQLNTLESCFKHTAHFSQLPGSWVSYTFIGTLLSMFGPVTPGPEGQVFRASAAIDGGSPTLMPPPQPQSSAGTSFNTPLFTSPSLSQGRHTINFTVSSDSAIPLYVDYFLIQPDSDDVTQQREGSSSTAAAASSLLESATSTSSSHPFPTISLPPKDPSSTDRHRLVAEIVGPVAALLILVLLIGICRRCTRRTRRSGADVDGSYVLPLFTGPSAKGRFLTRVLWSRQQDHGAQRQDSHQSTTMPVPFPIGVSEIQSVDAPKSTLSIPPASLTGAVTVQRNVMEGLNINADASSTYSSLPPSYSAE